MPLNLLRQSRKVLRSPRPQAAARLSNKAKRLRARGKFHEAVALLDRAIRLDSRMAYAENGQFDEAIHWQTEVLATVPEEKRPRCEAILEKYRAGIPQRGQSDS